MSKVWHSYHLHAIPSLVEESSGGASGGGLYISLSIDHHCCLPHSLCHCVASVAPIYTMRYHDLWYIYTIYTISIDFLEY